LSWPNLASEQKERFESGPLYVEPAPVAGLEFSVNHSKTGEVSMPHYEFICNACKKTFSKMLTIAEHEAEKTACPHCGSQEVEQSWSAFSALTSRKSA
jgi:putative FmdB family regulatory protein